MDDANDDISEYEKLRLKKIEENRKCLLELGLLSNVQHSPRSLKGQNDSATPKSAKKRRQTITTPIPVRRMVTRRSAQLGDQYQHESIENDDEDQEAPPSKKKEYRENFYGAVAGVKVGDCWEYRLDCSMAGVHRPTVAGIHGGSDGAFSIALSGGYEDDIDYGDHFTYTGAGGRDLKGTKANPKNLRTAPQSKDQTPDGYNAALIASVRTKNPVRVIRGYKLSSLYAPESGYRYDGLYTVDKYWTEVGLAGFLVYKFSLSRIKEQDPPVWELDLNQENSKQHINCPRTQSSRSSTSPQGKNTELKFKSPPKKSPPVVHSHDGNLDLIKSNGINGFPSSKLESQKVSPSAVREGANKSPTKIISVSPNKSSTKIISVSPNKSSTEIISVSPKKDHVLMKVVTTPLKLSPPLQTTSTNSNSTLVNSEKTSPKNKVMIVAVKSKSPVKNYSVSGKEGIHRFFTTVSHTRKISPKQSLAQDNSSTDIHTKNVSSPSNSSDGVTGKIVEPLKVNGHRSPSGVESEIDGKKSSPLKAKQSPNKISQAHDFKSPKKVDNMVTCTSNIVSSCEVSSPAKSPSQKVPTPKRMTEPKYAASSERTSQEKNEVKSVLGLNSAGSKVSSSTSSGKILFKRNLFNGDSVPNSSWKTGSRSPKKQSPKNSPLGGKSSLENSPSLKITRSSFAQSSSVSPSKMYESPKKLRAVVSKVSPGNSTVSKLDDSLNSSKSPPSSDQKKGKPSNTLDRYLVKKFASNDFSRANRPEFRKVSNSNNGFDSDDESTPAFIGFNEITINNSRNRLKLLSDFFPSIMKKQTYRTKLNQFKKTKKTDELTRCSSSKREFITSIDKIRNLSTKISNMSKFDPNAGFIPECFVKCSKIDSETSSSDEEKQFLEREESSAANVFFFGESCSDFSNSDSNVSKKGLSPQKLLDLISSDEENDDEPFLGFRDVSTRSIIRNAFLIQKYAKISDKN